MMHSSDFLRTGSAALLAVLAAGCVVSAPPQPQTELTDPGRSVKVNGQKPALINEGGPVFGAPTLPDGSTLINEGGPVFALPGSIRLPSYVAGDLSALTVKAERLDGGAFPGVEPASVATDGAFTLKGPITSQLFFASTEFMYAEHRHRVRALARAQSGDPIVLDVASSLISAKVALAAQKRSLDDLSYTETNELTAQVRSALGPALAPIRLDVPNETLSAQLTEIAKKSEPLALRLEKWEAGLNAPVPPASPSPDPSASAPVLEPVK